MGGWVVLRVSVAKLIFIALGKRKSESESESTEVTSGMSTDEEEEKKIQKGKKLLKHKDKKRGRKGKGMHSEMLPLFTNFIPSIERESISCTYTLNLRYKVQKSMIDPDYLAARLFFCWQQLFFLWRDFFFVATNFMTSALFSVLWNVIFFFWRRLSVLI